MKTDHKVVARHCRKGSAIKLSVPLIKRAVIETLNSEQLTFACEVNVLITNDDEVRKLNITFRDVDEATDVLSFPMKAFIAGHYEIDDKELCPETNTFALGDVVLSSERVHTQAKQYGHSVFRETAYLTIHSVLHLLGYDHVDESEGKRQMRQREEIILKNFLK